MEGITKQIQGRRVALYLEWWAVLDDGGNRLAVASCLTCNFNRSCWIQSRFV